MTCGRIDHSRRGERRRIDDERNPQCRLVGKDAVRRLAVIAERLTVIRSHDHERVGRLAGVDDGLQQRSESRIGRRDFPGIGVACESRCKRLGRRIRVVRLVEMNPAEPRFGARSTFLQPTECRGNGLGSRAFLLEKRRTCGRIDEGVVIDVEAARQAEPGVERKAADEGARVKSARLEARGERGFSGGQSEAGIVAHAVFGRQPAGEDVGVRGQREHVVCAGAAEPDTAGGEAIHPRRRRR